MQTMAVNIDREAAKDINTSALSTFPTAANII